MHIANVGDLNGDGVDEVAVSDQIRRMVHIFRPDATAMTWTLVASLAGGAGFGVAIASGN